MDAKKIYNQARVDEAAEVIAAELKAQLDRRNYDSPVYQRLKACPAYATLTNADGVLATLKALNLAALDVIGDMASLTREATFEEFEEDIASA